MRSRIIAVAASVAMAMAAPAYAQSQGSSQGQRTTVSTQMDQNTVMQVQQKLNQQGFHAGNVDGKWGPRTQAAVRNYQHDKGMQTTGRLDGETLASLGISMQGGSGSTGSSGGMQGSGSGSSMSGSGSGGQGQ